MIQTCTMYRVHELRAYSLLRSLTSCNLLSEMQRNQCQASFVGVYDQHVRGGAHLLRLCQLGDHMRQGRIIPSRFAAHTHTHTHTLRVRLRRCGSLRRLRVLKQVANSRIAIIPATLNSIRTTSWVSRLGQLGLLALHRSLTWELGRPNLQNSGMGQSPRGKPKCMKSRKPSFVIQTLR